jgi:nucleoside 2-deoxyribosyltransferase
MKLKIYAAGPDVFRGDAKLYFDNLKRLGEKYGFIILCPFDTNVIEDTKPNQARQIAKNNFELIDECDIIVANLRSFRGVGVDDGTCIEIGYGYNGGKIICGYCEDDSLYKEKAEHYFMNMTNGLFYKKEFPDVEDFDLSFNLMIHNAIMFSGGVIKHSFEEVLQELNKELKF